MNENKQYKASLFAKLFDEEKRRLEIYNAISGSSLPPGTPAELATLEDILFIPGIERAMEPGGYLELEVPFININQGHNTTMIQRSETLRGYTLFVAKVREKQAMGYPRGEAITLTLEYCTAHGILDDILSKLGSEGVNMLTQEFNLEDALSVAREEAFEDGVEEGMEKGEEKGRREGMETGKMEVARKLKEAGVLSVEDIARFTGASVADIEKL